MSDYDVKEESISDSAPFELYEFIGTYSNYYLTSDNLPHSFNSKTYNPVAGLKRNALGVVSHGADNKGFEVIIPVTEQIVKDYGFQTTPPSLTLNIWRLQRDAVNSVKYFSGIVSSVSITGEFAKIGIQGLFSYILNASVPNCYVQPPCNNVLFDELCKVSRTNNSLMTTISSVLLADSRIITIPSIGVFPNGFFVGGEIAVTSRNERRMIVNQTGTVLTVNYPFAKISVGTSVQVTAGCDHSYAGAGGCPKFNNQANFGGLPFVPGEANNIFIRGV